MGLPFTFPIWAGTASITGRTITLVSGSSFTDDYPGFFLLFEINPSVMDGIMVLPPWVIDGDTGKFMLTLAVWFIDSSHLEIGIDATYDLLIPAGTVGNFTVSENWPVFNVATCWASGNDVTSAPNSTIVAANPSVTFGGDYFNSGTSLLTPNPQIFLNGTPYYVSTVNSGTDVTIDVSAFPSGGTKGTVVTAIWQAWTLAPAVGAAYIKAISVGALPAGSGASSLGNTAWEGGGFTAFASDQWQFYAQVRGNTTINTSVTWSCSLGSINTSTGAWTAPSTVTGNPGVVVTATSNQDGTTIGEIFFQLSPQTAMTVDIDPLTYTPPSGWKLSGGPGGLVVGGLTRRLIIPA